MRGNNLERKNKKIKVIIFIILGIFVLGIVLLFLPYKVSRNGLTFKKRGYQNEYMLIEGNSDIIQGEITLPSSISGIKISKIGNEAFKECVELTNITIPDSVVEIGYGAFKGCTKLKSITIPDSVVKIGYEAFSGCSELTSITISNGVTEIYASTFLGCTKLESVQLSNSVIGIYASAFEGCVGLKNITIPNSVEIIGYDAFRGCTRLTSITIPNSVIRIDDRAFMDCTGLTSIMIPNNVKEIYFDVFSGCTGLQSVTITENVKKIYAKAFLGCTELKSIIYKGTKVEWNAIEKGSLWNHNTGDYIVYCTDGNKEKDYIPPTQSEESKGFYTVTRGANGHYTYRCIKNCNESCGNGCKTCITGGSSFGHSRCNFNYGASSAIGWIGCYKCGDVSSEKWFEWYRNKLGLK